MSSSLSASREREKLAPCSFWKCSMRACPVSILAIRSTSASRRLTSFSGCSVFCNSLVHLLLAAALLGGSIKCGFGSSIVGRPGVTLVLEDDGVLVTLVAWNRKCCLCGEDVPGSGFGSNIRRPRSSRRRRSGQMGRMPKKATQFRRFTGETRNNNAIND